MDEPDRHGHRILGRVRHQNRGFSAQFIFCRRDHRARLGDL